MELPRFYSVRLFVCLSSSAFAQDTLPETPPKIERFVLGAEFGRTEQSYTNDSFSGSLEGRAASSGFFLGYKPTPNIMVKYAYNQFEDADILDLGYGINIQSEARTNSLGAVLTTSPYRRLMGYAELGVSQVQISLTDSVFGIDLGDDKSVGIYGGLGGAVRLVAGLRLEAAIKWYSFDDSVDLPGAKSSDLQLTQLSVGLNYSF